jgi:hypothetical protein
LPPPFFAELIQQKNGKGDAKIKDLQERRAPDRCTKANCFSSPAISDLIYIKYTSADHGKSNEFYSPLNIFQGGTVF